MVKDTQTAGVYRYRPQQACRYAPRDKGLPASAGGIDSIC